MAITRTYQSQRKHTRLDFSPLVVTCELVCITPDSPVAQTSNATIGQYEPDRSVSPTVIRPQVTVNDPDNIYSSGINNHNLSSDDHAWFVNGKPIAEVWTLGTDYTVTADDTDDNGSLVIMKNLVPGDSATLAYEGIFNDFRTGVNYVVSADGMVLTTTDKGEDKWGCCVDCGTVDYDPLHDNLLLYDYLTANSIETVGTRESRIDGKCYVRTVTVTLTLGTETLDALPDGVTMRLVERGGDTPLEGGTVERPEITSVAFPSIVFDLRFVGEATEYEVQFVKDSKVVTSAGITLLRTMTALTQYDVSRGNDIAVGQAEYFNSGLFAAGDTVVYYPELYYDIQWWTQARVYNSTTSAYEYDTRIDRQAGQGMQCTVDSLGIGYEKNLSWFDVAMDVAERAAYAPLADSDGTTVLTDESGNALIY